MGLHRALPRCCCVHSALLANNDRLQHVADPRALTDTLLEVLPRCPPALQREAIGFIPEVASEDDYEVRRVGRCACVCTRV